MAAVLKLPLVHTMPTTTAVVVLAAELVQAVANLIAAEALQAGERAVGVAVVLVEAAIHVDHD
eukprot:12363874-Prorocentrum_lima.AAC.1